MNSNDTQRLRNHMQCWLRDWPRGLSSEWQQVLHEVMPDFNAIRYTTIIDSDQRVYPRRYQNSRNFPDAPVGSHIFRALNNVSPSRTRVVYIGQDPYPRTSRATGRAFEVGDKKTWDQVGGIRSMRRICQQVAAKRANNQRLQRPNGWKSLKCNIADGTIRMPCLGQHFDDWERQGVLLLNQSLTATTKRRGNGRGPHPHLRDHLKLWKPVVSRICSHLAGNYQPVFVLLGSEAQNAFDALCDLPPGVCTVRRAHPAYSPTKGKVPFLEERNLFDEIDEKLLQSRNSTIDW